MNQSERRHFLINALLDESASYKKIEIPKETGEQKSCLEV